MCVQVAQYIRPAHRKQVIVPILKSLAEDTSEEVSHCLCFPVLTLLVLSGLVLLVLSGFSAPRFPLRVSYRSTV
jgi:hypothetical protein